MKNGNWAAACIHSSLLPCCRCGVASCLNLLLPWLPCWELWAKIKPFPLICFCQDSPSQKKEGKLKHIPLQVLCVFLLTPNFPLCSSSSFTYSFSHEVLLPHHSFTLSMFQFEPFLQGNIPNRTIAHFLFLHFSPSIIIANDHIPNQWQLLYDKSTPIGYYLYTRKIYFLLTLSPDWQRALFCDVSQWHSCLPSCGSAAFHTQLSKPRSVCQSRIVGNMDNHT